ncbi:MAG: hypothetical protein ACLFV3_12950 [Phycisphaeraceae bacterium]
MLLQSSPTSIIWLLIFIILLGFVGMAVLVALMATWRNYNRRGTLLDQGRKLRESQHFDREEQEREKDSDIWSESGRRLKQPTSEELEDEQEDEDEYRDEDEDEDERDARG